MDPEGIRPLRPHAGDDAIVGRLSDQPTERFLGLGEGAQGPTAAAVANATANATGKRLRALPFTPERVKQAMA